MHKAAFFVLLLLISRFVERSKQAVEVVRQSGKICILDIDAQGVKLIKNTSLDPWFVFVKPPGMQILEERLRARSTETEESLQKRLSAARVEMEYGEFHQNLTNEAKY